MSGVLEARAPACGIMLHCTQWSGSKGFAQTGPAGRAWRSVAPGATSSPLSVPKVLAAILTSSILSLILQK